MSDIDNFFIRANALLDRLGPLLPLEQVSSDLNNSAALQWRCKDNRSWLETIKNINPIQLDDLKCIDHQKTVTLQNTKQFMDQVKYTMSSKQHTSFECALLLGR